VGSRFKSLAAHPRLGTKLTSQIMWEVIDLVYATSLETKYGESGRPRTCIGDSTALSPHELRIEESIASRNWCLLRNYSLRVVLGCLLRMIAQPITFQRNSHGTFLLPNYQLELTHY
jgi:hypothetical protein